MADQHLPPSDHFPPFSSAWFASLGASLAIMYRVIHAVIIREARTRYGSSNIGYAWALIDPTDFTRALDQFLKTRANLIIAAVILFLLARWVWRELKKIFK